MQINISLENLKRLLKFKGQEFLKWDEVFTYIINKNYNDFYYYSPENNKNIDL